MNDMINKYIEIVDKILSIIPYKRMLVWKEFFFDPKITIGKNVDGYLNRIIDLYAVHFIGIIIIIAIFLPSYALGGEYERVISAYSAASNPIGIIIIAGFFALFMALPLFSFVYALLEFIVAKILGGKADFKTHYNASVLPHLAVWAVNLPFIIASIPLAWVSSIHEVLSCCVGIVRLPISIAAGLLGLYGYYLKYLVFIEVHKLSGMRSIGVVVIPMILTVVIMVMILVAIYFLVIASVVGSLLAGKATG